ncbi:prolyl oligopeptidase family protein [Rathayibacter sp. PhB93]|uniref:alpha/beta hydrolase family protein n=1 Tax=unclassified Rathayibacter TaxID=2609250 RepID=UPI000F477ABC|nr:MULTISPECIES: alpha/beta fold hydrolase [unclassified Rathayibacter]ROQ15403.1 prolyl oligopeptidase family protein [Rathayibacter sp. PhB93]TDQ15341.1 prolyl oligopeptidase family protein [Rathayibacter sp. PhB1]
MSGVLDLAAREADQVLRYGEAPEQIAEHYRGSGRGLVLFVHGGFWRARWDRSHARPLAAALADAGWSVLLLEYRRVGDAGGGWPGTFDDVLAAVAALPPLVPVAERPRTVLVGHSAGGHLALWSQAAHPSPHVDAVVSLAGVADLRAAADERLGDGAVAELLGPDGPLDDLDPARLPAPPMPTVLLHGALDDEVPIAYSRRYCVAHPSARLVELPDADHYAPIDPRTPAFATLLAVLDGLCASPQR